jgi:hypothetical protein
LAAERRVELDETTNSPSRSSRASSVSSSRSAADGELALVDDERRAAARPRRRGADRGDLGGVVPQQPPIDPRAERARLRRELGEVVGRRVRVDDAAAGEAREADVRQRASDAPSRASAASAVSARSRACLWFGPDAATSRSAHRSAAVFRPRPAQRPGRRVEGHSARRRGGTRRCARPRSRRRARRGRRTSRASQVDAAALEDLRLLAEVLALLGGLEPLECRSGRSSRPM